jgi:hypothetical protein
MGAGIVFQASRADAAQAEKDALASAITISSSASADTAGCRATACEGRAGKATEGTPG